MRIIDVHTHPIMQENFCGRAEVGGVIARAKALGIVHLVALGDVLVDGRLPNEAQVRRVNDDTAWLMQAYPGFVTGFCYLNPVLGERAVRREVERCRALGFRGIKLEIANNARDACMRPVMAAAAEHDLVVLQHAWSMTKIRQRRFHTDPEDVATLARRHPEVRIIMAHLTGCGVRGVLAVKSLPNVWVDTSGAAPESGIVEYAVEQLGAGRILYGSDVPVRDFAVAIARVTGSALSAAEQRRILHDNARELLRLP
ncbi:amidohydrolase family protein [Opitutus sp. ER46]|uniref:amidohydrolase family protein n=1 Tax=Opitutus sp. ER46 TaxID=2161864 RepID=UPI000D2FBB2E|nr:amidohydrolase family protein [Opitutus sp. ER46]PTX94490.1 amidohydrolase [Opitutus sp. ER46]